MLLAASGGKRIEGAPVHLPARIDLSAYRIVQEALTKVRAHSRRRRRTHHKHVRL
jgi:signal transduction histidine kinase